MTRYARSCRRLTRHEGWRCEDDLSDVARGAHEVQGCPGLGERPPAVDYGPQFTRRKPRHNVSQDDANPGRVGLLHDVQFKDVVGNVGTHCRHLFMAQDVPPGHLDESTALSKARRLASIKPSLVRLFSTT